MAYKKQRSKVQKKFYVGRALRHILKEKKANLFERRRIENFEKRTRLCGRPIFPGTKFPIGYCNKACCNKCNWRWATNKGSRFTAQCPDNDWINFRFLTIMLPVQSTVEASFKEFDSFRKRLSKSVIKSRDLKKNIELRDQWRAFSLTGGLEIDCFEIEEFDSLGSQKKQDLIEDHKFDKDTFKGDRVYQPHVHAVVYIGDLDDKLVHTRLSKFCINSHMKMLSTDKSVADSVNDILCYSGKMSLLTTLEGNKRVDWDDESMAELIDNLVGKQGKRSFSMRISRFRNDCKK